MVEMYKQNKGEDDIYRVFLSFMSLQLEKNLGLSSRRPS